MRLSEADWSAFLKHIHATLDNLKVQRSERDELVPLIQSTKDDTVEA